MPIISQSIDLSNYLQSTLSLYPFAGGEILTQLHNGHTILLSVLPESLSLSLTAPQTRLEARVQARLLDNRWHDIHLLYEQGTLQLVVDKQSVVVGKCSNFYVIIIPVTPVKPQFPLICSQFHVQHTVPRRPGY